MTEKFKWAKGSRIKIPAQLAGERLGIIRKKAGRLTPQAVLDDAKLKRSPLHGAFEWRNDKAAEAFRLQQASYLLRSIEIVVQMRRKNTPEPVRAFLNVKTGGKREYSPLATVMNDDELRKQVLKQAIDEIADWKRRYETYSELSTIVRAIDKTLARKK